MGFQSNRLQDLLNQFLRPRVKEIDEQGMYPMDFLKRLGQEGFFSAAPADNLQLIREVAVVCSSTAFVVWCQAAAVSFVQNGGSEYLKRELLPSLLAGEVIGGTGISNAMKFYAGMEDLKLDGEKTSAGYRIKGVLPFVSNLGPGGWFGIVFRTGESKRAMALVPCHLEGLSRKAVDGFLGLNGTATYSCQFQNVDIPQEYILTEHADELIAKIRPGFLLTQVGLSLGITRASLDSMFALQEKQNKTNRFLPQQPEELEKRLQLLGDQVNNLTAADSTAPQEYFKEVVRARLDSAYLAMDAAQAEMLHAGAAGYVAGSSTSRRLREAMFIAVVTPAIKQLEKMLQSTPVSGIVPAQKTKPLDYVERIERIELELTKLNASRALAAVPKQLEVLSVGGCVLLREQTNPASIYYYRVKGFGAEDLPNLETILDHYPDGAPCFDLTPNLMAPDVSRALTEKGYLPAEQLVFLYADLSQEMDVAHEIQIEPVTEGTAEEFVQWIALSNGGMELTEEMVARSKVYFYRPDFQNYMLMIDGNPAAMGSMFVHGQEGYLANDYTFPAYRGRGCQTALIRHRFAEAAKLGLHTVYTDVEFGSASHANMERAGFRTAYLSTFWVNRL